MRVPGVQGGIGVRVGLVIDFPGVTYSAACRDRLPTRTPILTVVPAVLAANFRAPSHQRPEVRAASADTGLTFPSKMPHRPPPNRSEAACDLQLHW